VKSKTPDIKENGVVAAVVLFFIAVVVTAALASVNYATAPVIRLYAKETADKARLTVFPDASSFEDASAELLPEKVRSIRSVAKVLDAEGNLIGLVIESYASGYGGDINIMTGIQADRTLIGLVVLSNSETPGLGTKVAAESFTGRFLSGIPGVAYTIDSSETDLNTVDAITGSTISSRAVMNAVNAAVAFSGEVFQTLDVGGME
jgi:Na+-translocating ferredoxin:NAD+ oxidoreductase subunit G